MLRENNKIFQGMHQGWDLGLTLVSFISAYYVKRYLLPQPWGGLSTEPNYYALLMLCIIIWYSVFRFSGVYRPYRKRPFSSIALDVLQAVAVCAMILLGILFFVKEQSLSRIFLGLFILIDLGLLIGSKWVFYKTLRHLRKTGFNTRNIVIVGTGPRAGKVIEALKKQPESGLIVIGCLTASSQSSNEPDSGNAPPVLGNLSELEKILTNHVVDELIFVEPLRLIANAGQYIQVAEQRGISVHILPEWGLRQMGFTPQVAKLSYENMMGMPILSLMVTPDHHPALIVKNIIDVLLSGLGLVLCAIPFALIAVAIKITSPGPVFFRQERIGQNGRVFTLYKFRTMVPNADKMKQSLLDKNESDGPVFKIRNDPRVIPFIGSFLRKTSLDELPQLINVLKGEMSLVGPRPPLKEETVLYKSGQHRRLSMKPGITCLWQISPQRNDISFWDWVKLDLEYIDHWSLGLDFKILFRTMWVAVTGQGR